MLNLLHAKVCMEIVELDRASVYRYPGNYARYLELRAARIVAEDAGMDITLQ